MLSIIREHYGPGYADDEEVAKLQAKLSIMYEAKAKAEGLTTRLKPKES